MTGEDRDMSMCMLGDAVKMSCKLWSLREKGKREGESKGERKRDMGGRAS